MQQRLPAGSVRPSPPGRLWHRSVGHYPDTGRRTWYLAIVVLVTIMLCYELYVGGSVAPSILQHCEMTFRYYVYAAELRQ